MEQNETIANLHPEGDPIAEIIYTILSSIGAYLLFVAIQSGGESGFGDIAAALSLFMQLIVLLLSLPFLIKSVRRKIKFELFRKFGVLIPTLLLLETIFALIQLNANFSENSILIGLMIGFNTIPLFIFLLNRQ